LIQRRDEEAMLGGFDGPRFSIHASRYYWKYRLGKGPLELWVHLVVAKELLNDYVFLVEGVQVRARPNADLRNAVAEFGRTGRPIRQGTGNRRDHDVLRSRIVLRRIGITDSKYVARTLYQSVLKAPSSADERPVAPTSEFNAAQHPVKALVGARWRRPQAVEGLQFLV